jgi:hypothetical protein
MQKIAFCLAFLCVTILAPMSQAYANEFCESELTYNLMLCGSPEIMDLGYEDSIHDLLSGYAMCVEAAYERHAVCLGN